MTKPQKSKDDKTLGMKINISAIESVTDNPNCISIQEINQASAKDKHLQQLREHIIRSWPKSRNEG